MQYSPAQRLVAEFIGALALVFVGVGSIVVAGAGGGGLVTVALAHGLAIATMVSAVGHVSGGHFNPAVTFAVWIAKKIETSEAALYVVAQLLGGVVGALLVRIAMPEKLWKTVSLGTPLLSTEISAGQGLLIEAVLTFFLVWVVFGTAVDPEGSFGKIAGLGIGFVIVMDICAGGPFTGAAMNPARSFGPALVGGYWSDAWIYWVGPLLGAAVAALLATSLHNRAVLDQPPVEPARER